MKKLRAAGIGTALLGIILSWYVLRPTNNLSKHLTADQRNEAKATAFLGQDGLKPKMWDEYGFITKYQEVIKREAQRYDLPARLLAANIYGENINRRCFGDFKDRYAVYVGKDPSLEVGQMRLVTAMYLDGEIDDLKPSTFNSVDEKTKEDYRKKLADPEQSIGYIAKELARLRDLRRLQIGKADYDIAEQRRDRKGMALIRSWYTAGTDLKNPNVHGINTMEVYDLPWLQKLFPEDTIYSCLDTIIKAPEAVSIKKQLGKGIEVHNSPQGLKYLETAFNQAKDLSNKLEWGKGREYYMSIEIVSLMYQGRHNIIKGNNKKAHELYGMALERRLQLDQAYIAGVDIPTVVGSGSGVKVADRTFMEDKYRSTAPKK